MTTDDSTSAVESGDWVGRPTDEQMHAYLEGEHGPPSPKALLIIQAELEHDARQEAPRD